MSHLSGECKALSEEERSVFDEMAKQDKRRHNAKMVRWMKEHIAFDACVAFCSLYFGQFVYCVGIGYLLLECANDYNVISLLSCYYYSIHSEFTHIFPFDQTPLFIQVLNFRFCIFPLLTAFSGLRGYDTLIYSSMLSKLVIIISIV